LPPLLAISRCRSESIDAKPRFEVELPGVIYASLSNRVRASSTTRGFDGSDEEERTFAKNFMKIFIRSVLLRLAQMFESDKRGNILFMGI
jgi:hypothetical protein